MRTHTQEKRESPLLILGSCLSFSFFVAFICSHPGCGKAFTVRSNMRRHERTHTADSAFEGVVNSGNALSIMHECSSCNQQFNSPSDLEVPLSYYYPRPNYDTLYIRNI